MTHMILSILIPAYNEQATIEQVIQDHVSIALSLNRELVDWELVCLDDASTDETFRILERLRASCPKMRVIRHEKNQGINASFLHLFEEARGTHIYYTASDGQWPARNLSLLLRALVEHHMDLVVGVRPNRREIYGLWRRLLSYGFNWIPQVLFGVNTMDANSIKLGVREVFTMNLMSKSFFGEVERIIEAKRRGYRVGFETIEFLSRRSGKAHGAKWSNVFGTMWDCCRYAWKRCSGIFLRREKRMGEG